MLVAHGHGSQIKLSVSSSVCASQDLTAVQTQL